MWVSDSSDDNLYAYNLGFISEATALSSNQIRLSWNAIAGANIYRVYRSTQANGVYTALTPVTGTTITDSGLSSSTKYYYQIAACTLNNNADSAGNSCSNRNAPYAKASATTMASAKILYEQQSQSYVASSVAHSQDLSSETIVDIGTEQVQIASDAQLKTAIPTSCFTTTYPDVTSETTLNWLQPTTDGSLLDNYQSYRWGEVVYGDWDVVIDYANDNQLCGFDNWRIPTAEQLQQLANNYTDFDKLQRAIPNLLPNLYWTTDSIDTNRALAFDFSTWQLLAAEKFKYQRVILIREK